MVADSGDEAHDDGLLGLEVPEERPARHPDGRHDLDDGGVLEALVGQHLDGGLG
jgi:hypothetical protein